MYLAYRTVIALLTADKHTNIYTEAPVNGYAPLLHCDRIHLSSTVSDDVMAAAWSLLKAKYPSVPEELMAVAPRHHAMLAYLCQVRSFRDGTCWTPRR